MATLTGNSVASTYTQLLKITSEGIGADASAKYVEDGLGTDSALSLSTTRVGIGTDSPAGALHTVGSTNLFRSTNNENRFVFTTGGGGTDGTLNIYDNTVTERIYLHSNGDSYFNGGNVGIGTTSPAYTLDVAGNIGYSGTITDYSDQRLKDNIEDADLDTCYDTIKNLKLKRYHIKDGILEEKQDRNQLGWIAQEVEEVMPKSIFKHDYKYNQVYKDETIEAKELIEWEDKPTEENTKAEIKAWMDSNSVAYNSGDTKADLISKIPAVQQEASEEKTKQKLVSEDVIEDCYGLSKDQIYATMFGAIQKLQAKVEALENK